MSEYAVSVAGVTTAEITATGKVPELNLERERAVQNACLEAAEAGLLLSAHDASDGGLAVALAESCFSSLGREAIGAEVNRTGTVGPTALLFSESPSRIIVSFDQSDASAVQELAERNNTPIAILGRVIGSRLTINVNDEETVAAEVSQLETAWRNALSDKLQTELVAG